MRLGLNLAGLLMVANALFRSGYIESWERGINKMTNLCLEAGLPKPEFEYYSTGLWVTLRKDIFNEEHLLEKGLNERQVRAVMYVKENERVTNREYQALNKVSNRTATYELTELVYRYNLLDKSGAGAGTYYHA